MLRLEWLGRLKKCSDFIGNRTPSPDFPACSVVPQPHPTTLPRARHVDDNDYIIFQTKNDIRGKLCISGERGIFEEGEWVAALGEPELTKTECSSNDVVLYSGGSRSEYCDFDFSEFAVFVPGKRWYNVFIGSHLPNPF
jgi:hypothetical protein